MSHLNVLPVPEVILEMEPQELAPYILLYLSQREDNINKHNFLNANHDLITWAGSLEILSDILLKFSIAWSWLERELMIASKPGGVDWYFITPLGKDLLGSSNFDSYMHGRILPSEGLDPILLKKVKTSFLSGDYDTAIFQAFREVEVRVRDRAGLGPDYYGVKLMTEAFKPDGGILTDPSMVTSEKISRMELFKGSIGAFKNPSSHRYIDLNDPNEAAGIIQMANILLKIIEHIDVDE